MKKAPENINLTGQVILAFWACMLVMQLVFFRRLSEPLLIIGSTAGALAVSGGIYWLAEKTSKASTWMWRQPVNVAQIVFTGILASDQAAIILQEINPRLFEAELLFVDKLLFGMSISERLEPYALPYFTDWLQLTYASYFFLPLIVFLVLYKSRQYEKAELLMATVSTGMMFTLLLYYLVPARSPYVVAEEYQAGVSNLKIEFQKPLPRTELTEKVFTAIHMAEANKRDCFPSGHTGASLILLVGVWRYFRKWFIPYSVVIFSLIFSTVYLRYHYLLDLLAGGVWCWVVVTVIPRIYYFEKRRQENENSSVSSELLSKT